MRTRRGKVNFLLLFLFATALFSENAYAYIDPGSGSYFFQILAAGFFAGAYALKMYWHKFKGLFVKAARGPSDSTNGQSH